MNEEDYIHNRIMAVERDRIAHGAGRHKVKHHKMAHHRGGSNPWMDFLQDFRHQHPGATVKEASHAYHGMGLAVGGGVKHKYKKKLRVNAQYMENIRKHIGKKEKKDIKNVLHINNI